MGSQEHLFLLPEVLPSSPSREWGGGPGGGRLDVAVRIAWLEGPEGWERSTLRSIGKVPPLFVPEESRPGARGDGEVGGGTDVTLRPLYRLPARCVFTFVSSLPSAQIRPALCRGPAPSACISGTEKQMGIGTNTKITSATLDN